MTSRAEKAQKNQKDKHHAILRELVQEPTNKTCAECLAKGPRWASWSLGVFVCIRCAGIHRNLGVHISKMKSIDLDSWTTEQLDNMLKWGNKRAAEYFECYLPKDFVRPQTNHALESFIRNKYEKKLYIKKDGEPEPNPQSKLDRLKSNTNEEKSKSDEKKSDVMRQRRQKKKDTSSSTTTSENTILNMASQKAAQQQEQQQQQQQQPQNTALLNVGNVQHQKSNSMNDLLSLSSQPQPANDMKQSASSNDLLNFGSWSDPVASTQVSNDPFLQSNGSKDPFQSDIAFEQATSQAAPVKSTKESILSLYSTSNPNMQQQQMPGMYMPQSQGIVGQQPNQMQMNQLNMQMENMMSGAPNGYGRMYGQQSMGMYQMNGMQNMMGQQQQQGMMAKNWGNQQGMMGMRQQQGMMGMGQQQGMMGMGQQQGMMGMGPQQGMMGMGPQQGMMGMGQQQGMMGMGQMQGMMSNGNMGNFGMNANGNTSNGSTMNNLLWN